MEDIESADKVFVELKLLEKQMNDMKRDNERPAGAPAPGAETKPVESRIEEMSHLLLRIKEQASATLGEAIRKQKEWAKMKAEMDKERGYIRLLQKKLEEKGLAGPPDGDPAGAGSAGGVPTDMELTAEEDKAHNRLEGERKEFKQHYDSLENDFEAREKELLDEIRSLREKETRMALENEKLSIDLSIAQQRREAAEQKASSAAARMMEMDVYNKSAALAVKEKDQEISDLKQAVEEAKFAAPKAGK